MKREIVVILEDFRSVYNTASCFRTADGAGVKKIYLAGTTPVPLDRFKKFRKDFSKVALGAEKTVEWEKVKSETELVQRLKDSGFMVAAVEQSKKSEDIFSFAENLDKETPCLPVGRLRQIRQAQKVRGKINEMVLPQGQKLEKNKIALIFGNEVEGVSQRILKKCDKILEIPMRGKKESLNVAVVFGVAVYAIAITNNQETNNK